MSEQARVLIVEDNEEIAQMLVLFLGSRGYKVILAPDGETAVRSVREALPTLMLLDVGLPDVDGYDLLTRFRRSPRTRYIPAIFLTQRNKKADRMAGLQLGADDYITKPFDLEELFLRVQNAVQRAQRENLHEPRTGLPTGRVARDEMEAARGRADRAIVEFRLENTGPFRDQYGMLAMTDLLRYTALHLNRVLNQQGTSEDFLGHLGEERFVVVCGAARADLFCRTASAHFDRDAVQHYTLGERLSADEVRARTPSGETLTLPIVKLTALRQQ